MSLTTLDKQLDEIRAEADQQRKSYWYRIQEVNLNSDLSDEGKKTQRDRINETFKTKLRELRHREDDLVNATITRLETSLDGAPGGTSTDLIAFRDAQDRAERLEQSDDAKQMLERALRTNDKSLAFAIFRKAIANNWRTVVDHFTTAQPTTAETVKDLDVLYQFRDDTMARTMVYALGS